MKFIPPLGFAPVVSTDVDLYRSGYPMPLNYSFIKHQLHLKTVIYVGDKEILPEYAAFLEAEGIQFHHIPMTSTKDDNIQKEMETVLSLVLNVDNYPILIHSNKGKHRVGVVVGIIRKLLLGWSMTGIYQEYDLFTGGQKGDIDLEFITMFNTSLTVPLDRIPRFVNCKPLAEPRKLES